MKLLGVLKTMALASVMAACTSWHALEAVSTKPSTRIGVARVTTRDGRVTVVSETRITADSIVGLTMRDEFHAQPFSIPLSEVTRVERGSVHVTRTVIAAVAVVTLATLVWLFASLASLGPGY